MSELQVSNWIFNYALDHFSVVEKEYSEFLQDSKKYSEKCDFLLTHWPSEFRGQLLAQLQFTQEQKQNQTKQDFPWTTMILMQSRLPYLVLHQLFTSQSS